MSLRHRVTLGFLAGALIALGAIIGTRLWHRTPGDAAASPGTGIQRSESPVASPASKYQLRGKAPRGSSEDRWQQRWREIAALTDESARDREKEALIEELAAIDPMRAIELARSETDSELQTTLLQAALRGWGGAHPDAAAAWAMSQTLMDAGQAMASVFHGATRDPENALRLIAQLSEQDPEHANDYGSYLVAAFARAGKFDQAAAFAASGASEVRVDWLNSAFSRWADADPRAALKGIAQLPDLEMQATAFDAAVSRWSSHDPKALAEYALGLSEGRDRTFALSAALRNWAGADAPEVAAWVNRFGPARELDFGIAMIAAQPDAIVQPQVATGWAESIVDPRLRVRILASIVNEWAATDPVAARRYAENIRSEDRAGVLAAFDPGFKQFSLLP